MTDRTRHFETAALPHLGAAYNLARWLLRDEQHAHDAVQEAYLRAFRFFDGLRGDDNARPWLLGIVRNTCYDWLRQNRPSEVVALDDAEDAWREVPASFGPSPIWKAAFVEIITLSRRPAMAPPSTSSELPLE